MIERTLELCVFACVCGTTRKDFFHALLSFSKNNPKGITTPISFNSKLNKLMMWVDTYLWCFSIIFHFETPKIFLVNNKSNSAFITMSFDKLSLVTPFIHVHVPSFSLFPGFYFLKGFHPHKNLLLFFDVHFIFCQIFLVLCILWRRNGDTRNYICYYCSTTDRKWIINYIDSLYKKLCIPISYLQQRQEAWHDITKHMTKVEGVDNTFSINID